MRRKPHEKGVKGEMCPLARYKMTTAILESCQPIRRVNADYQNYYECNCEGDVMAASNLIMTDCGRCERTAVKIILTAVMSISSETGFCF